MVAGQGGVQLSALAGQTVRQAAGGEAQAAGAGGAGGEVAPGEPGLGRPSVHRLLLPGLRGPADVPVLCLRPRRPPQPRPGRGQPGQTRRHDQRRLVNCSGKCLAILIFLL